MGGHSSTPYSLSHRLFLPLFSSTKGLPLAVTNCQHNAIVYLNLTLTIVPKLQDLALLQYQASPSQIEHDIWTDGRTVQTAIIICEAQVCPNLAI